jgi:GDP-mannose 6-dehydrogenase
MNSLVIPALESSSGKVAGREFGVCFNPEFLREGSAIRDYRDPPKTVIGATENHAANLLHEIYASVPGPKFTTSIATAEMVKYVDNAWHALKVSFANEVGSLCKALHIDSHEVMDIFVQDTQLNLSPYYLKPGFAFGGSCLPKDVRALNYVAKNNDLILPVLSSILPSNEQHVQRGLDLVLAQGKRRVGVLGFSFKAHTDDLRESPVVELIERLIGKGYDLRLYDRNVNLAKLMGANREYILTHIPHISRLMLDSAEAVMHHAEVVIIGNGDPAFADAVAGATSGQTVIDLVRVAKGENRPENYHGICW